MKYLSINPEMGSLVHCSLNLRVGPEARRVVDDPVGDDSSVFQAAAPLRGDFSAAPLLCPPRL